MKRFFELREVLDLGHVGVDLLGPLRIHVAPHGLVLGQPGHRALKDALNGGDGCEERFQLGFMFIWCPYSMSLSLAQ